MLRTERITAEPAIRHEIETYNDLLPGEGQLSLTVFIQIADAELRARKLVELCGFEDSIGLEIDGRWFPASGKRPDGFAEGRTTAVHYLKVPLDAPALAAMRARTAQAAVCVRHPRYQVRAE